jgi:hypothetical protein
MTLNQTSAQPAFSVTVRPWERRRTVNKHVAAQWQRKAARELESPAHLEKALAGDDEAVLELCYHNERLPGLGLAALAAYWGGTPLPAYQELLRVGWSCDWLTIKFGLRSRFKRIVRQMFKAGRFEHHLEGQLSIYRGASGVDAAKAAKGVSWTTNRDVACWFAFRDRRENPVVITANVDASDVMYFNDEQWEQEVVPGGHVCAELDLDPDDWVAGMRRYADLHGLEKAK